MVYLTSLVSLIVATLVATSSATNSTTTETSTRVTTTMLPTTLRINGSNPTISMANLTKTTLVPMANLTISTPVPLKREGTVPVIQRRPMINSKYSTRPISKWIEHKQAKLERERKLKKKRESKKNKKHGNHGHKHKSVPEETKPIEKSCPECERKLRKEQLEMNRMMSLKRQIMEKLQIDPTKNFRRPVIPQEILRQSLMEDESSFDDEGDAKTTDLLVFGRDITNRCRYRKSTACFKFNLRRKVRGYITSAELYVYKLHDPNDGQQTIFLQELERPKHRKLMPRNIVNRVETDITEGWMTFRLDKTVMRWAKEPLANDGIAVKCKTCAGTKHNQIFSSKEGYRTFLVVHIQPVRQRRRQKRSIDCGDIVHSCCKHDFWVDFEDINLAQVIHPKGLWANYCTGPCGPMVTGHYNHTSILQAVRWRSESANNTIRNAITPCCGAVRLKTISLLYVNNEGDISRADVPNLQLAECGCL